MPKAYDVAIYNMARSLVRAVVASQGKSTISASGLSAGVYLVKVVSEGKSFVQKVAVR